MLGTKTNLANKLFWLEMDCLYAIKWEKLF